MGNLTYTNLFSEARNNIVTLISNNSNVPDPVIGGSEFRKWIYAREPDVKSSDFGGYPYIIIHGSDFDVGDGGSVDTRSKSVSWDIEIEIVSSDRGHNNISGKGLTHMDTISNKIMTTLLNVTNRNTLRGQGMKFIKPITTGVVSEILHDELVFRRSIMVPAMNRMQVTA